MPKIGAPVPVAAIKPAVQEQGAPYAGTHRQENDIGETFSRPIYHLAQPHKVCVVVDEYR